MSTEFNEDSLQVQGETSYNEHVQVDELSLEELNAIFGGAPQTAVQELVKANKESYRKKSLEEYLDEDIPEETTDAPMMRR